MKVKLKPAKIIFGSFMNFFSKAEVIDVAMIVARCGCTEVNIDMMEQGEGYVCIIDGHTKVSPCFQEICFQEICQK
jgi:hypothetical protein